MSQQRTRMSLNGDWQMDIGDERYAEISVPSSYHPVGVATLKRTLPRGAHTAAGRLFVVFEGIANEAEVSLAGHSLGHMVAFTRHAFDVTDLLSVDEAELAVTVRDLHAEFGNTPGWETYGGIVRDVYLERVPEVYVIDAYYRATVDDEGAGLAVAIELCNATDEPNAVTAHITLCGDGGHVVAEQTAEYMLTPGSTSITDVFRVEKPLLWSPEEPHLYEVTVELRSAFGQDVLRKRVGFRWVEARGRRFYLNGHPLFLKGICRHDTWLEQGYTLTTEQMRQDMQAIKDLGANFVRLVHYPHHPGILDLADEIGLFVTEEPGLWNVRLSAENMGRPKEIALEIMRRTIIRDRSHPCLFAWLLGNECWPDRAYLNAGKRLCNVLDPGRLVGFSHLYVENSKARARFPYQGWDPDFYDTHPYGEEANLYRAAMCDFTDKPLIFGEWGGYWVQHNDWLMQEIGRAFATAAHAAADDQEQLSGIAYWEWADMRQYHRGYPACEAGVLTEGLVTEDRRRKHEWDVMRTIFQEIDAGPRQNRTINTFGRIRPGITFPSDLVPLDVAAGAHLGDQERAWEVVAPTYTDWLSLPRDLDTGVYRLAQMTTGKPLLVSPLSARIRLDVRRRVSEVWLIGLGTLTDGFPVARCLGDGVARIRAVGQEQMQEICLRQGRHIARQNALYQGSRINPVTLEARLLFEWIVDPDIEIRHVRVYDWHLPQPLYCDYLEIELIDDHSAVVLHAISIR